MGCMLLIGFSTVRRGRNEFDAFVGTARVPTMFVRVKKIGAYEYLYLVENALSLIHI